MEKLRIASKMHRFLSTGANSFFKLQSPSYRSLFMMGSVNAPNVCHFSIKPSHRNKKKANNKNGASSKKECVMFRKNDSIELFLWWICLFPWKSFQLQLIDIIVYCLCRISLINSEQPKSTDILNCIVLLIYLRI